jgi:serine/threonine-protein kinase HipA
MISEARPTRTDCFVYVMLPGETRFVAAGRFAVSVDRHGVPTGRFVYGKSYLARANAVALDPLDLKLADRVYETGTLRGMFGAIRDASPDYWGRRVIEKYMGAGELSELDYLLHSPDDRAGALGFGLNVEPPAPRRAFNRTIDLERLQALADTIIADEEVPASADADQTQTLLLAGTSMGGARPKAVVEDREALWIAKFNRADDRWNNARVEHAMLTLARECGLQTAESRLERIGNRDVLLVKRFDRQLAEHGYQRARMLSALTLLRAGDMPQDRERWSYVLLAEELRRVSRHPEEDAHELFRRMCFNTLISNTDDHPRNHAVIASDSDWRLSPAYDLTPTTPVSVERRDLAMSAGDLGRYANAQNLISQSARFLLAPANARATVDEMEATVKKRWYAVARAAGVSEGDCEKIAGAFAYRGFRLETKRR